MMGNQSVTAIHHDYVKEKTLTPERKSEMTKLEKNIINAIDDANTTNSKIDIGVVEDGKSYAIKCDNKTLALYWGEEKVVVVDSNIYTALATKLFVEYIKF